jgi:TRAP-type mannitol/chloroaromatic compound transport system permease large subunit
MFPGFFLSFLYLAYIIGWAMLNPKIAPRLPEKETRIPPEPWSVRLQETYSPKMLIALLAAVVAPAKALAIDVEGARIRYPMLIKNLLAALVPLALTAVTLWGVWWYVVIHPQAEAESARPTATEVRQQDKPAADSPAPDVKPKTPSDSGAADETPQELGTPQTADKSAAADEMPQELGSVEEPKAAEAATREPETLQEMGDAGLRVAGAAPAEAGPAPEFYTWFWISVGICLLLLVYYYWILDAERFQILKLLISSTLPLGILTFVVLAVILFGITTATESAAVGAAGAFLLAIQARTLNWKKTKEAVFLTAKTTAMVCWLFVGSAIFSAVFAILGGQALVEHWVLSLNMTPVQFMMLSQAIIFLLGWPLEWTEIIIIFVPIFLPLLKHFNIDPILWGTLVFVNLQAAFLSPPVAMSAFYLKGVSPPHVTLNQIFGGMMPYMMIVILCLVIMYVWPGMTLWLPAYLYGQ